MEGAGTVVVVGGDKREGNQTEGGKSLSPDIVLSLSDNEG